MVSGSRIDGGAQVISAGVRRTIQSIKEIVGNHSDAEIYVALKETNMDPNETTQKLLNQGQFSGKMIFFCKFYFLRAAWWFRFGYGSRKPTISMCGWVGGLGGGESLAR